jgi:hypothetical protein
MGIVFSNQQNCLDILFVLITGGISIWFLTFFYWFVDVMGLKSCSTFIWIGTNSITIYLAVHNIINFESTAHYFLDGMLQNATWMHKTSELQQAYCFCN